MHSQLCHYLEKNTEICNEQFGFRKRRSTIDAMDLLVKQVLHVFEKKGNRQATFCELSKAFDCVDHRFLLDKLFYFGIREVSSKILK